jgi:hypothetical protein
MQIMSMKALRWGLVALVGCCATTLVWAEAGDGGGGSDYYNYNGAGVVGDDQKIVSGGTDVLGPPVMVGTEGIVPSPITPPPAPNPEDIGKRAFEAAHDMVVRDCEVRLSFVKPGSVDDAKVFMQRCRDDAMRVVAKDFNWRKDSMSPVLSCTRQGFMPPEIMDERRSPPMIPHVSGKDTAWRSEPMIPEVDQANGAMPYQVPVWRCTFAKGGEIASPNCPTVAFVDPICPAGTDLMRLPITPEYPCPRQAYCAGPNDRVVPPVPVETDGRKRRWRN